MTIGTTEPLPVLQFRLREARRQRRRWFTWGAVVGVLGLFLSVAIAPTDSTSAKVAAAVVLILLLLALTLLLAGNLRHNKTIRHLGEQIAWAQAPLPSGSSEAPKTDLAAWLTFASGLVASITSVIVAMVRK